MIKDKRTLQQNCKVLLFAPGCQVALRQSGKAQGLIVILAANNTPLVSVPSTSTFFQSAMRQVAVGGGKGNTADNYFV
jgi:hypothetical protein